MFAKHNSIRLILVLLFFSTGFSKKSCKITQTHITLGDYFTAKQDIGNFYTIATIVRGGDCDVRVKIYSALQKLVTIHPSSTIEYNNEERSYSAVSYKFFIPKSYALPSYSWKIETTDDIEGMNVFPSPAYSQSQTANLIIIADMDVSYLSQPFIDKVKTLDPKEYDFLMHIGDFAYNVHTKKGTRGDDYFQEMSDSFSKNIPYVVVAGNHESAKYEGKFFDFRFRMPGVNQDEFRGNHYYSFNYKGVHYVTIDWDYIFNLNPSEIRPALQWLKNDLETANNDHLVNFVVFFSHRPFYCPSLEDDHCKIFYHLRPFEMMLRKYKVDLYLMAHSHQYFRLKKQADFVNKSGSEAEEEPLMVVQGAVGCNDGDPDPPSLRAEIVNDMTDYMYTSNESAWLKLTTSPDKITGVLYHTASGKVLDQFEVKRRAKGEKKGAVVY